MAKKIVIDEIDQSIENAGTPKSREPWQKLVPLLMEAEIDGVVTYEQMDRVLGLGSNIQQNRSPYYRALTEVQVVGMRTFECVRGEGYRRVHPNEHTRLSEQRSKLAQHHLRVAEGILQAADANHLTPHEQRVTEESLAAVQDNLHHMGSIDERLIKRVEALVEARRQQEMKLAKEAEAASGAGLKKGRAA